MQGVEKNIKSTQKSLSDVEKLLKLDPTNTELLAQKQKLLQKEIGQTEEKLKSLRDANDQVKDSVKNYDAWEKAYTPIKTEIDETNKKIKDLKSSMKDMEDAGEIDTQEYKNLQSELAESTKKLRDLRKEAKSVNDEFGNPISTDQYDALQREIIATENDLKSLKSQASDTESGISKSAQSMKDSLSNIGEGIGDIGEKLDLSNTMDAYDALSDVGDGIIDMAGKTVSAFSDIESATNRVNSYFGLTGDAAEEMGTVVENVFRSGVTGSLDEVADAVIFVNNNLKDLDPSQLQEITIQAMKIEEVFGSDMSETMRGVNSLMVNFGLDAQTAMDYIVKGSQNGLDKTQELGDNLSEYSGKFSQAGYSASEYFQLLQNGLEGGAYNLDKVNDSINEVTTKLADGTIAESLGQFSENTQNVFKAWQEGGATQKDVINAIVSDIANATTQQDALSKASVAFGTMGEDANMGVITSLTTLGDEYSNVAGAAQSMADNSTTPMQELQASLNELTTALAPVGSDLLQLATQVLPPVVEAVTKLIDGFMNLPGPVKTFLGALAGILALLTTLAPLITAIVTIVGTFGAAVLGPIIGIIAGIAAAIALVVTVIQNWGSIVEWFQGVWNTVWTTVQNLWNTVWTAISQNPVVQAIVTTVQNLFNGLVSTLSTIWNTIQTVASNAWELIKNVVLAPVLLLIDLVTGDFDSLKSDIQNIWNNIKNAATNIWNAIKSSISSIVSNIKSAAVNGFNAMVSGIKSAISGIGGIIKNGFQSAIDFITSLPSKALQWGADFINGLKDGILSGISGIVDAVKGVGDKIRSFLHFSRPDEGPLRDYETWMPDMMKGLAEGIYDNLPILDKAVSAVAKSINYEIMKDTPVQTIDYNRIYSAVKSGASDSSTVMYIGDRPFKRVLKDMGVAFVG